MLWRMNVWIFRSFCAVLLLATSMPAEEKRKQPQHEIILKYGGGEPANLKPNLYPLVFAFEGVRLFFQIKTTNKRIAECVKFIAEQASFRKPIVIVLPKFKDGKDLKISILLIDKMGKAKDEVIMTWITNYSRKTQSLEDNVSGESMAYAFIWRDPVFVAHTGKKSGADGDNPGLLIENYMLDGDPSNDARIEPLIVKMEQSDDQRIRIRGMIQRGRQALLAGNWKGAAEQHKSAKSLLTAMLKTGDATPSAREIGVFGHEIGIMRALTDPRKSSED